MLLQRVRLSDEFMDEFRDFMGERVYKKYKAIYYLCELSKEDESVYADVVKTYLSQLKVKHDMSYVLKDYTNNGHVYKDVINIILSEYIKEYYDDLGNKCLSRGLIKKIANTYLKIQDFYREEGITEVEETKKFFKKLKKKGDIYRATCVTTVLESEIVEDKSVIVVAFEPVEGIGSISTSFYIDGNISYNFSV